MTTRAKNTYTTSLQTGLLDEPVLHIKAPIPQPSMFGKIWNSLRNKSANAWNSVKKYIQQMHKLGARPYPFKTRS